jgi:hypothetical protein
MTTDAHPVTARTVRVAFEGDRGGRWPVTVGQGNVFDWATADPGAAVFSLHADLPAGRTLEDIGEAVAVLVSRHEGLRTFYLADPEGERSQTVVQAGHLEILLLELDDQACRRTQVTDPYRPFDHGKEYPLRVAVALDHGSPRRVIFEFSHLSADLVAATIVLTEFAELMATPARHRERPRAWQPADQAEYEHTAAAVHRLGWTLDYWRAHVSDLPPCMLSVPAHTSGPPEFRLAAMRSAPASAALREISARTRISPASLIVSTFTTLLSWWTDNSTFAVDILYSNRSLPHMGDYVGTVAQSALLAFARTSSSFLETLHATHAAVLDAYRFAHFDGTAIAHMVESVGIERGCERHRDLVINDMSAVGGETFHRDAPQGSGAADGGTEIASGLETSVADPIRLTILRTRPAVLLGLSHDVRHVSDAQAVALLGAVERMLTTVAERDIDLDDLGGFLGLDPARRAEGWLRLNAGWVDLPTCERLLRQVTGDQTARVFAEDGELVGYWALPGRPIGLERLHSMAMAGLDGRHGAVTPDRYVLCAQAPRQPDSHAAWRAQPVLMAGSGR